MNNHHHGGQGTQENDVEKVLQHSIPEWMDHLQMYRDMDDHLDCQQGERLAEKLQEG